MHEPDCVTVVTMAKRRKTRAGNTIVFSISVDRETARLLRKAAAERFRGNVSRLVAEFAEQAARQQAAHDFLTMVGAKPMTDDDVDRFMNEIAEEARQQHAASSRRKRGAA
jgi:hydrogenase maturation factor